MREGKFQEVLGKELPTHPVDIRQVGLHSGFVGFESSRDSMMWVGGCGIEGKGHEYCEPMT